VLPPPYHHGNTIINPVPVPGPSPVPNAFAKEKEKGIVKGEEKTTKQTEPVIAEMLTEIKSLSRLSGQDKSRPYPELCQRGAVPQENARTSLYPGRNTKLLENEGPAAARGIYKLGVGKRGHCQLCAQPGKGGNSGSRESRNAEAST